MQMVFSIIAIFVSVVSYFLLTGNIDIKNILNDSDKATYLDAKKELTGNIEIRLTDLLIENQDISIRDKQLLTKLDLSLKSYYKEKPLENTPTCSDLEKYNQFSTQECNEISNKNFKFYTVDEYKTAHNIVDNVNIASRANQMKGQVVDTTTDTLTIQSAKDHNKVNLELKDIQKKLLNSIDNSNFVDASYYLVQLENITPQMVNSYAEEIVSKANSLTSLEKEEIKSNLTTVQTNLQDNNIAFSPKVILFLNTN